MFEKETAGTTRESVLNRPIDCRTRETVLLPSRRERIPRHVYARWDGDRLRGVYKIPGSYFIATITATMYSVFGAGPDNRISVPAVLPLNGVLTLI